jgi:hypothetical protein
MGRRSAALRVAEPRVGARRGAAARAVVALASASLLLALVAAPALAHEQRTVAGFDIEVGLIGEPVFVGDKSGLDLQVTKDGKPVEGLATTVTVDVEYGSSKRTLTLQPAGETLPGYVAPFIPTAAGKYTFHLGGSIEGAPIDENFTSSPTGFEEVREAASGEFPATLPTVAELAAQAKKGADAAALVPVALGVGAAGLLVGLLGIGVALAGRRRADA